jgi:hypothetical protein
LDDISMLKRVNGNVNGNRSYSNFRKQELFSHYLKKKT